MIVGFAILLGFLQEDRAERAIAALRKMTAPVARVLRDGTETEVPARDLVPGDLLLLGSRPLSNLTNYTRRPLAW